MARDSAAREVRLAIGLFGLGLIGVQLLNTSPFLTGALIDGRGLSPAQVGALSSVELLCSAALAILLAWPRLAIAPRTLALGGCALLIVGYLASTSAPDLALYGGRGVAGLGEGLIAGAGARSIARSLSPARLAAYLGVGSAVAGAGLALAAAWAVGVGGYRGGCLLIAGSGAVAFCLAFLLPVGPATSPTVSRASSHEPPRLAAAAPMLAAASLMVIGAGGVWGFAERIGLAAGLSRAAVADSISLTALATIGGGALAVVAARAGRDVLMAAAGIAALGVSVSIFAFSTTPAVYVGALIALSFASLFAPPFLTAIMVRIDPNGGLNSAAAGAQLLAGAAAPAIGGALVAGRSFAPLGMLTAVTSALAVAALLVAARQRPPPAASAAPNPPELLEISP